jgi:hypothetical protein
LGNHVQTIREFLALVTFDRGINVSMERFGVIAAAGDARVSSMPHSMREFRRETIPESPVRLTGNPAAVKELPSVLEELFSELLVSLVGLYLESLTDQLSEQSSGAKFFNKMAMAKIVLRCKMNSEALESRAFIRKDDFALHVHIVIRVLQISEPPIIGLVAFSRRHYEAKWNCFIANNRLWDAIGIWLRAAERTVQLNVIGLVPDASGPWSDPGQCDNIPVLTAIVVGESAVRILWPNSNDFVTRETI